MFRTVLLAFAITIAASCGHALDLSLGAAMTAGTSPYKKHDATYLPAPLVRYEGDHFYVKNASVGAYLFKNDNHKIGLGVSYFGLYFNNDDTDYEPAKQLDDRRSTLMADINYEAITKFGLARLKVSRDILGYSDGFTVDAGFHVPFIRECYTIMPGVGVLWSSRKQSDYYFGIRRHESERSGLNEYSAKANFSPYVKLEGKFDFTPKWSAVAGVYANFLSATVKNSPMTGRSVTIAGALGVQYQF
ncbi:MAG: MipA/OmpV family protein [Planctomycetaceae bacterium]|nr:MipA/OmpV family protein [Planctomycetaceae bacterium]